MEQTALAQLVSDAIDELNAGLEPERQVGKEQDVKLVGTDGVLDSLGLVNLCVTIEEMIEAGHGELVSVMDLITESDQEDWTVADLVSALSAQVGGAAHA